MTIVIADDDQNERLGIRLLLSKISLSSEIHTFSNGEDALEYITVHHVELLITDIKMPLMDGLELIRNVNTISPFTKSIILSAYDNFEYARQAIGLDVSDYLLKPISPVAFEATVSKVVRQIEQEQQNLTMGESVHEQLVHAISLAKEKLLYNIITREEYSDSFVNDLHLVGIRFCNPSTRLILISAKHSFWESALDHLPLTKDDQCYFLSLNDEQQLLFVNCPDVSIQMICQVLQTWLETNGASSYLMLVSNPVTKLKDFPAVYQNLELMLDYSIYSTTESVIWEESFEKSDSDHSPEPLLYQMLSDLDFHAPEDAFQQMYFLLDYLSVGSCYSKLCTNFFVSEAVKKLIHACAPSYEVPAFCSKYLEPILNSSSLEQIHHILDQVYEEFFKNSNARPDSQDLISRLKQWMEHNFMNEITLADAAAFVYLSPSYLSCLFKKECGESFVQYLTHLRLQKSKELLLCSNRKINDIATMVGYSSSGYFIQLFKSHFGYTPAKFRESRGIQ